ncbi:hypothetical protein BLS_006330 [Venturia inaequalis]|uniref:Uncharacterized protein n=1 Tax=Venturia inaequalis TaxID=5025 RepID=A0A8H3UF27_VENIN|nr:hypothetical protein BLS_006330 [Venturia inaequalis]KAE9977761.1 hypothetical protein EG327_007637 [Venturia inaequalis]KAE9987450.1 hypothetical protein EG328_002807 [Venturia inaequalis]
MARKQSRELESKYREKMNHLEHEWPTTTKVVLGFFKQPANAKERRERKEKQRQQASDLFKKNLKKFFIAVNKTEPIVCASPTGLESTSNNTSISSQPCQSYTDHNQEVPCPSKRQDHADHLIQARLELTELKACCKTYALEKGYQEDDSSGKIITNFTPATKVWTEDDFKEITGLIKALRAELDGEETSTCPYTLRVVEWVSTGDKAAQRERNNLPFDERQRADWAYVKKRQEQYRTVAELDPRFSKQMRSKKATTVSVQLDTAVETLGSYMSEIDYLTKILSTHRRRTPFKIVVKEDVAMEEELMCILPDSVSYTTLKHMALKQGRWKRHGKLLNGAQMMMARNTFKSKRSTLVKGSSGLGNEYRPHDKQKALNRIDSFGYMTELL